VEFVLEFPATGTSTVKALPSSSGYSEKGTGMVLRNEASGIRNKIVIMPTSQNLILLIMTPIVSI
jgi:hypothetical protein